MALGAMALSLVCEGTGRGKWGIFIGQWVPTLLIIGVYNKLVKLEGRDRAAAQMTEQPGRHICEFCESKFSFEDDLRIIKDTVDYVSQPTLPLVSSDSAVTGRR